MYVHTNASKALKTKTKNKNKNKKKQKQNKTKQQKKTVVSLATFVALQVWYGIPNERVPKSPLNSG